MRIIHANRARFFFICIFLHIGRGLYYGSYTYSHTWLIGVTILLLTIASAFLGYVLPWGQISFWGATVITNLFSAIPYIGNDLVIWIWGGFAIDNSTLTRFYSLHFLLPFAVLGLTMVHLLFLHQTGSNNPLGLNRNFEKIIFNPYFSIKDLFVYFVIVLLLFLICFLYPWIIGDPENFIPANPLVTPIHIQPEWYFLMAYAILRSIPNKLGGVIALAMSIIVLYFIPFIYSSKFKGNIFYPYSKILFWSHVNIWLLLTWLGARPVDEPFIILGQVVSSLYFINYLLIFASQWVWDTLI